MLKGIYVFNPTTNFDEMFQNCVNWGINWIVTPAYIFQKESFQLCKKKYEIKICVIFAVYNQQEYLEKHPEDYCITSIGKEAKYEQRWLHFACPSSNRFIEHQKNELTDFLNKMAPDMIALDFIRFYVFWERVYPKTSILDIDDGCYCERCLDNFETYRDQPLGERTARWIKINALSEWAKWKCEIIEKMVKELTEIIHMQNSHLPIMIKTVPWLSESFGGAIRSIAGQDLEILSPDVDFICPMTYSYMTKHPSQSIHEVASEQQQISHKKIIPCIQVNKAYLDEDISKEKFDEMLQYGLQAPSAGVILFLYETFKEDLEKQEIFKQRILST